ncbi:MAG: hypothetical protein WC841_05330 [Candidatus Shapirobacteria bacterium]
MISVIGGVGVAEGVAEVVGVLVGVAEGVAVVVGVGDGVAVRVGVRVGMQWRMFSSWILMVEEFATMPFGPSKRML